MGEYSNWGANLLAVGLTFVAVGLAVLTHYYGLRRIMAWTDSGGRRHGHRVLRAIFGVLYLHTIEIWLFAVAAWSLLMLPTAGGLSGAEIGGLLDLVYFSATVFTTLGFGDLVPHGPLRFLVGTEAMTGFVLITWSASFTYLEMERYWKRGTA